MAPSSALTRLRLRALGLYTLATVALALIPFAAAVSEELAFLLLLALGVAMACAVIQLSPHIVEVAWFMANWRALAGRLAVYFTAIGSGTTLLFAYRHPAAWACGAAILAGGAVAEWRHVGLPGSAQRSP